MIETLKTVDENRKCFRLIGDVLCERTVKEVLPQLIENKAYLEKSIGVISEKLTKKGIEINKFKEEHNIRIHGQEVNQTKTESEKGEGDSQASRNVLVTN